MIGVLLLRDATHSLHLSLWLSEEKYQQFKKETNSSYKNYVLPIMGCS
jgi:hypothetical protein